MIRRYLLPMPGVRLTIGKQKAEVGTIESRNWIGLEIDSDEPVSDEVIESRGLVYADVMTDEEQRAYRITEWKYVAVKQPS